MSSNINISERIKNLEKSRAKALDELSRCKGYSDHYKQTISRLNMIDEALTHFRTKQAVEKAILKANLQIRIFV